MNKITYHLIAFFGVIIMLSTIWVTTYLFVVVYGPREAWQLFPIAMTAFTTFMVGTFMFIHGFMEAPSK